MTTASIIFGTMLLLIGGVGYAYGLLVDRASVTALIPALFGVVLVLLGAVGHIRENLRKHLMHAAVVVALLGFILTAGRLVSKISEIAFSPAVISQAATAVVCLIFVILAIKSFANARRSG